jgi:hypothetical protein
MAIQIDPRIGSDEGWLLYTIEEGGEFKVLKMSYEDYQDLIRRKYFFYNTGDAMVKVYPAAAFFSVCVNGYDFRLEQINKDTSWTFGEKLYARKVK